MGRPDRILLGYRRSVNAGIIIKQSLLPPSQSNINAVSSVSFLSSGPRRRMPSQVQQKSPLLIGPAAFSPIPVTVTNRITCLHSNWEVNHLVQLARGKFYSKKQRPCYKNGHQRILVCKKLPVHSGDPTPPTPPHPQFFLTLSAKLFSHELASRTLPVSLSTLILSYFDESHTSSDELRWRSHRARNSGRPLASGS